jgi:predicted NBD/HSP70 family sugar kinase
MPAGTDGREGFNLPTIRGLNAALVLRSLREAGDAGSSQARIAEAATLTPQAISKIVSRLEHLGLVQRVGQGRSTGGKPPTLLRLRPTARWTIGIYLDRDQTTFVINDLAGNVHNLRSVPIGMTSSHQTVLQTIKTQVTSLIHDNHPFLPGNLVGVGVACPGPLDTCTGTLGPVTHLPHWHNFKLLEALQSTTGLPVTLWKDTDAAARAVHEQDHGPNHVYVHFGAGLGAGLILGGEVYQPRSIRAGEFGHQTIDLAGPTCDCGRHGCLELLCLNAAEDGDLERAAHLLGVGLANLDRLLGIDRVTLGGKIIDKDPALFQECVSNTLAAHADQFPTPQVSVTSTPDATFVSTGMAMVVLDSLFQSLI